MSNIARSPCTFKKRRRLILGRAEEVDQKSFLAAREISHQDGLRSSVVKRMRLGRISMRHQLQENDGHFSMPIVSENV